MVALLDQRWYVNASTFAAGGNPYGTSASVDGEGNMLKPEEVKVAVADQTKRLVAITTMYLNGK